MATKKKTVKKQIVSAKKPQSRKSHNRDFLKVYWPYLPLFILVFFGMVFGYNWGGSGASHSNYGVLSYATEMSTSGLLSGTNAQRTQNGLAALSYNSKLAAAAQSKANDMVARNYWSHTTPDGKDPWVFIDAAGYSYQKAGENLAYGFDTSSDTVVGWMNSASHRANILDSGFKEVGFGFANASSYVGTGEETIVVAMYANPVATQQATAPSQATPTKQSSPSTIQSSPSAQPTKEDTVVPTNEEKAEAKKVSEDRINQAITSDDEIPASQPATRITKLQSITSGNAPWSSAALSGFVVLVLGLWITKHAIVVKRVLVDGEKFILHHPLIDVAVLIIVAFSILLSQSSGVVK